MARQYLAEGLKGAFSFIPDASKIVVESLPDGRSRTRIPGRFSVCDCINGNGRRYAKRVWEKNLEEGSSLMQAIAKNGAFGLLEHPKDGQVDLRSNISHLVTSAKLQEGRDAKTGQPVWEVVGEIQVLDAPGFPDGQRLKSLIEMTNYNPMVSSRGFGSLVRAADGIDDVDIDYVCEGWDVIIKPSFETAELNPPRGGAATESAAKPTATITETAPTPKQEPVAESKGVNVWYVYQNIAEKDFGKPFSALQDDQVEQVVAKASGLTRDQLLTLESEFKKNLKAGQGSQASTLEAKAPVKPQNESQVNIMNLNEIKQAIAGFRSTDRTKLPPQQFAEGMTQLGALHQEVANFVAEDAKRSWQGTQLQNEIAAIENSWSETQLEPAKQVAKLSENNTKLMQVVKAVATTGMVYKNKLGETVKQSNRQSALLNEVVERGQAWRQVAKTNESNAAKYRRRFLMASEALTQLATKYKADVVELGKRVITLEFKEKAAAPNITKLLKEATKPKQIVEIRNLLEGKKTSPAPKQGTTAPSLTESKKPVAAPAGTPKAPVSEGVTILSAAPSDPRQLNEAIGMVTRLSKSMVSA